MIRWNFVEDRGYFYGGWRVFLEAGQWKVETPRHKVLPVTFRDLDRAKEFALLRMKRGVA